MLFLSSSQPIVSCSSALTTEASIKKKIFEALPQPRASWLTFTWKLSQFFIYFFSEWKMHTLGCGRNCKRWDPEIRVDGRHTGQNCDTDRSKYDENEENDDQTEKNTAQILRCTLKHKAPGEKNKCSKKDKWTPRVQMKYAAKGKEKEDNNILY